MSISEDNFFFEGVEKVLEIDFVAGTDAEGARGLRALTRAQIDELCTAARCTVIASLSNDHFDSYVLSESSLFVYPTKIILKTCGTTTLLMCLEPLLKAVAALGLSLEWVAYTRKNFQRPGQQKFPHRDHNEESTYLKQFFPEGNTFILGPITADHWVVFVADYVDRPTDACCDRTLDMMMFGIDEEVAKLFVKNSARFPRDADVTRASGIDTLLPGSLIQEFCFDPCGYSMNGLLYDSYWTIHITPESTFSYASFETNIRMSSYGGLIRAVLAIFRPRRWTMTLFADRNGAKALRETPFQQVVRVPVVASTSRAIMGPCVITHDAHGNSVVSFEAAAAAAAGATSGAAAAPQQAQQAQAPPAPLADAEGGSSGVLVDDILASAAVGAPTADELLSALLQGVGGAVPPAVAADSAATPSAAAAAAQQQLPPVASMRAGASSVVSYMMTTKSQTEFVGDYSAYFGIFSLLNGATTPAPSPLSGGGSVSAAAAATAAQLRPAEAGKAAAAAAAAGAATDIAAAPPRAKYIVARRIEELKNKGRTESF